MSAEGEAISISADELMRWEARIRELNESLLKDQAERDWLQARLNAAQYLLAVRSTPLNAVEHP